MAIKPVSQIINDPQNYNSYNSHYTNNTNDQYYQQQEQDYYSSNDVKPPPLTIDHNQQQGTMRNSLTSFSPASIPSPVTPADHPTKKQQPTETTKETYQQQPNEIEALVHEGITYHEKGQLEKATSLFRIAAEKANPIGMFLYGVSLRHGWVRS
jgi:hypothetical protein